MQRTALLAAVDTAQEIKDMSIPGFRLHQLKSLERTPESWLAMQYNYDLWHARQRVRLADVEKIKLAAV